MPASDFELDLIPRDTKRFALLSRGDGTPMFRVEQRNNESPEVFARNIARVVFKTDSFTALVCFETFEYGDDYLLGALAYEALHELRKTNPQKKFTSDEIHFDHFAGKHVDSLQSQS